MNTEKTIHITAEIDANRIDSYLANTKYGYSRNYWQSILGQDMVYVNTQLATKKTKIKCGDEIHIKIPKKQEIELKPVNISLKIIYEDKDMIVIDKPAGLLTHPADTASTEPSLVEGLLYLRPDIWDIKGSIRPGIVHRLDRDTSGLLVIAKHNKSMEYLSNQIATRKVEKKYKALVLNTPEVANGRIESPIGRSIDGKKMIIGGRHAKDSITEFEIIEKYTKNGQDYTLLDINLLTGRTHQIRVHLASIGLPILGDSVYGRNNINKIFDLKRQFLHAFGLSLTGINKDKHIWHSDIPLDLLNILNQLEKTNENEQNI